MPDLAYLVLEFATIVLFGLTVWHARQRGNGALLELGVAGVYGILLEWGNILIFRTYHYAPHFWLAIGPVPVVIGLCWGMIIYGAMAYSDQLGLPQWAAPFGDAIWAIMLDLAFDAIAIRLQLWTWSNPLGTGYFGVPADNFFAWLFVAFAFSAYVRWVRPRQSPHALRLSLYLSAPLWSFGGLLLGILLYNVLAALAYPAGAPLGGSMPIFVAMLAIFAAVVGGAIWRGGIRAQHGIDVIPVLTRWAMHGYFIGWAVLLLWFPALRLPGMDMPAFLIWVAIALLLLEGLLLVPVLQRNVAFRRQLVVPRAQAKVQDTPQRRHGLV